VIAKDGVNIDYNKEFILKADRALYRKETSEMKGVVSAYPKDSASVCHLIHGADEIDAKAVDLDTLSSTLSLHKAQGHIATSLLMTEQKGHMSFSSDLIVWDDPHLTLKLHGHSEIIEPALGTIHTDKTLTVMQSSIDGQKVISHVETEGHSVLTYKDAGSGQSHKISSFGAMKIDRDTLSATLSSPSKGRTAEQVYYEEMKMGVYADSASIEFTQLSDKIEPLSFSLKGHVTLFSRGEGEPFRCAIADRMSYNPSTKTLILSAMPGQKVLFWDEQQAVRMSAQEVHLTQNPTSQQAVIQGVGNVKFTLSTEENDALKKFFPQYKPQP
jgi:hypothetical protein